MRRSEIACGLAGVALLVVGLTGAKHDEKSKTIYHISFAGSTQIGCKITQHATRQKPWIVVRCDYRCDRPLASVDAKTPDFENIYCRSAAFGDSPAGQGQSLGEPSSTEEN